MVKGCSIRRVFNAGSLLAGLFCAGIPGADAQPVEIDWLKTFSTKDGVLDVYLSPRIDGSVVAAGHTNRGNNFDYNSRSFFAVFSAAGGGAEGAQELVMIPDRAHATAWSIDAARSTRGQGQAAVVVGSTGRGDWGDQHGGYVQVFERSRDSAWSRRDAYTTPDFQILAAGGLDVDAQRFFIGSGRSQRGPGGGYRGLLALKDFSRRTLWQDQIPGFIVNIADIAVSGALMYVAGIVEGALPGNDAIGPADFFIAAYDISGAYRGTRTPRRLWLKRFGTPGQRVGTPVYATMDREGNVVVTGWTAGAFGDRLADDTVNFTNDGYMRGFVVKVDPTGRTKWTRQFGGSGITVPRAITADCYGNLWVAGATSAPFRRDASQAEGTTRGAFVVRFDGAGNVVWTNANVLRDRASARDGKWSYITDIAIDGDGKLVVSGFFSNAWGTQPQVGRKGFVARLTDRTDHGFGANGYSKCRATAAPPVAGSGGRCPVPPDLTTWVNTCSKQSRPHEGFKGSARCSNGIDDDGDGRCDASDPDCAVTEHRLTFTEGCCMRPPDYPPQREVWSVRGKVCSDGWDNDGNGRCDALEPGCRAPGTARDELLGARAPSQPPHLGTAASRDLACVNAVQGKIPFGRKGPKTWNAADLRTLCKGAGTSTAPAECFDRLMRGQVSWGGGTEWDARNALALCAGARSAGVTLTCFSKTLTVGRSWERAVSKCKTAP